MCIHGRFARLCKDVECAETCKEEVKVVDPLDLSKETLDMIMGSIPEKEDRLAYLAGCFGLKDDRQGLLSDSGSCSKCTKEFPFFELQSDSDGCLAADAPQLEGNACSKCGAHMPGIGSAAKVMCARCRPI
jgi:hypothetical protein